MKRIALFLLSAVLIQSCTDPDTTEPTVEVLSTIPATAPAIVCGEMEDFVVTLSSTDTLVVEFKVSDDVELSQYKLDIHQNFDCHGHSGKVETTDWYALEIADLQGSEQTINLEIPVPQDVTSGTYHFSLQVTDVSGNSADLVFYSLNVTNASDTEAPTLVVTTPANSSFSAQKGDPINFQGSVTDNLDLGAGNNGKLELRYWNTNNQTVNELYTEDFESSAGTTINFDFDAVVPVTTPDGTYIFELRSFDAVNNPSNTVEFTVQID